VKQTSLKKLTSVVSKSSSIKQETMNLNDTMDDENIVLSITLPYYLNDPTLLYFKHAIQIAKLFVDKN
jgi:hypothetical protein